jgi:hypothetical protein
MSNSGINVSILSPRELKAHDLLIELFGALEKLSPASREKVYKRWIMLKLFTEQELHHFVLQFSRVINVGGEPDRIVVSDKGVTSA